jgi:hypothetical protein
MAIITITIQDLDGSKVKVEVSPKVAEMMHLAKNGKLESSHGYAFAALNAIRRESQSKDKHKIIIPRLSGVN